MQDGPIQKIRKPVLGDFDLIPRDTNHTIYRRRYVRYNYCTLQCILNKVNCLKHEKKYLVPCHSIYFVQLSLTNLFIIDYILCLRCGAHANLRVNHVTINCSECLIVQWLKYMMLEVPICHMGMRLDYIYINNTNFIYIHLLMV